MQMLVTGASGVLGRRVVRIARARDHEVVPLSRSRRDEDGWVRGDLVSGAGIVAAVRGCDVIVHCASDPRRHADVDRQGTANLLGAAAAGGGVPVVYPGIVGSDVIPMSYYRSKTAVEGLLTQSAVPHTIQRFTQFHHLIWTMVSALARFPMFPVPGDTRFQVLDPSSAAAALVSAAEEGPQGRIDDLGGPTAYEARDLARSVVTAMNRRRRVVAVNIPGLVGAAFRAGGNLTPNRDEVGATWNDFVAARLAQA